MLIKIYDLDATGLKMINLVKSLFFGQHRIITCCLLSESFQNQSQCFWVGSAPCDMLPLIPWYCVLHSTGKHPSWQNVWQEGCRDRSIQSSLHQPCLTVCQKAGSTCWEPSVLLHWKSPLWCCKSWDSLPTFGFHFLSCPHKR